MKTFKFNGSQAQLEVVSHFTGWENTCECCKKESNISTESYIIDGKSRRKHLNLCHICFAKLLIKTMPNMQLMDSLSCQCIKSYTLNQMRLSR